MALPSGYTKLEYIQSSGTQYIDTGFKPNQNTSIICDFQIVSTSGWNTVFGSWTRSGNTYVRAFTFLVNSDGQFRDSYGSIHTLLPTSLARNERYVVNKQKNVCTVGGETVTATTSTFSCSYNLYLFSGNTGGSASEQSAAKIYSCKIYDNGTLVRDFIPCKNASGTVGLWDDVNSKFYSNAGTGTFTAGPEVDSGGSGATSYTVNITGSLDSSNGYATINGTKITSTGTTTYTSKPTISVYVSANLVNLRGNCEVTLNGETVKSGDGSYTVDIGNADIVDIKFNVVMYSGTYPYYTCDITTETSAPPDPMAPHDGHNTNIGNVAREIEGCTGLIGGVLRDVESGLVLVGGVAREVEFAGGEATVTITGSGNDTYLYITIDGTKHTSASTVVVPVATIISCYARRSYGNGSILLNGTTVASGSPARYEYEVTGNVTIKLTYSPYGTASIEITEE